MSIVPVPFNLAIFDTGAARAVIDDHPEIASWAVGGHSLGGAAAALFVDGNSGVADGLALWASYSSADLDDDGVLVASIYGTLDNGVPSFTDPDNLAKLGPAVTSDGHRRRQPRADGLVHGAAQRPAGDDQPPGPAGPGRGRDGRAARGLGRPAALTAVAPTRRSSAPRAGRAARRGPGPRAPSRPRSRR